MNLIRKMIISQIKQQKEEFLEEALLHEEEDNEKINAIYDLIEELEETGRFKVEFRPLYNAKEVPHDAENLN